MKARHTRIADTLDYFVLFVHAPGGLGKISLLREFQHATELAGCRVAYVDARNVDPLPDAFLTALRTGLAINGAQPLVDELTAAELLDLPFSTYRRHLKDGVDRIVRQLWGREAGEF